jgi:hypothetical protein
MLSFATVRHGARRRAQVPADEGEHCRSDKSFEEYFASPTAGSDLGGGRTHSRRSSEAGVISLNGG